MTVFQRGVRWKYDFWHAGIRHVGYCIDPVTGADAANKTDAKRIETMARATVMATAKPAAPPPAAFTVAEMFSAYAVRKQHLKDFVNKRVYIAELLSWFGAATDVVEISEQRVWEYIAWCREQPVLVYRGGGKAKTPEERSRLYAPTDRKRMDSTINRYLVTLREALGIAHGLKKIDDLPKVPKLTEAERLPRPVSDDDIQAIIVAAPPHLGEAVALARLMGFRKAEIFSLTVTQVDFNNRCVWLAAEDTKGGRDEAVPASDEALALLRRLVGQARDRGTAHLITYAKKRVGKGGERYVEFLPVRNPKRAWATACRSLGIVHRFHDTKASYVTAIAHVAPAAVTQRLARHKSYETTQRYLRVADEAARAAVEAASMRVKTGGPTPISHPTSGDSLGNTANPLKEMVGATGFEPATLRPPV
jgi:integrase